MLLKTSIKIKAARLSGLTPYTMQSLVDKYLNTKFLDDMAIQDISYLTGLSVENIEVERDHGNILITQVTNGKWVFLSEDTVGTEITFTEFIMILKANRFLNVPLPDEPKWPRAEMMSEKIPFTPEPIVFKIDPEIAKKWNKVREKMDAMYSGIRDYQLVQMSQPIVTDHPTTEDTDFIGFKCSPELKEKLAKMWAYLGPTAPVEGKENFFWEAFHRSSMDDDLKHIQEMDDRIHEEIMKRGSGDFTPSAGIWKKLDESISQEHAVLNDFTQKIGMDCSCGSIDETVIVCIGMDGYNAGKALRDALVEFARNGSVLMYHLGEAAAGAVDSVDRISQMINTLKKQEPVDGLPEKHLSPKEFGLSLKRNQLKRH